MQKQKNPFSLMAFIRPHRAGFIASTVLAVLSVASGMVPYFAVAKMVNLLISAEKKLFDLSDLGNGSPDRLSAQVRPPRHFYSMLSRGHFPCAVGVAEGCGG